MAIERDGCELDKTKYKVNTVLNRIERKRTGYEGSTFARRRTCSKEVQYFTADFRLGGANTGNFVELL